MEVAGANPFLCNSGLHVGDPRAHWRDITCTYSPPFPFPCSNPQAGLLYVYSTVAVGSAKSNAKRLREQDGGTLDLHRQSLRQHGLLHDRDSVRTTAAVRAGAGREGMEHEEAIKAEARRRKEEARMKEVEEMRRTEKERNSLWSWIRGK